MSDFDMLSFDNASCCSSSDHGIVGMIACMKAFVIDDVLLVILSSFGIFIESHQKFRLGNWGLL